MFAQNGNSATARVSVQLDLDPGWCVDAMFGGALLRCSAEAVRTATGLPGWIAIEVSARFLRPMAPGAAVADVEVLHRGRRTCVAAVQLIQQAAICVAVLVTLAPPETVPIAGDGDPVGVPPALPAPDGPRAGVARRVDWRVVGDWGPVAEPLRAWIAPRAATSAPDADWCLVAADLLVPALAGASRNSPTRLASASIDVCVLARPGSVWLSQTVQAQRVGDAAHAALRLESPTGELVARATHRGYLLASSSSEMPYSATAFGEGVPH